MKRLVLTALASFAVTSLGCYVGLLPRPTTESTPTVPLAREVETITPAKRDAVKESPSTREVFAPPAPQNASTDSRVLQGGSASEALGTQLSTIRSRLADLKSAYDARGETEGDLLQATDKLKSLAVLARADCDLILRVARDQKAELPHHKRSYEATAEYYREKGRKYKTKEFQSLNMEFAEKFEKLAEDIPRRRRLTDAFIEQLLELQEFLAETERCLADTKVALSILSIGSKEIKLSGETRQFRQHLETFLSAVDEYQRRFFEMPTPPAEQSQKPPAPEKASPKKDVEPSLDEEKSKPPVTNKKQQNDDTSRFARQEQVATQGSEQNAAIPSSQRWKPVSMIESQNRRSECPPQQVSQYRNVQQTNPTITYYQQYHCNGVVYLVPVNPPPTSYVTSYGPVHYVQPCTQWRVYP
jgi:hypothetical protein